MNKNEKEMFIKRKVGFFYTSSCNKCQVEGIIKDVSCVGFIIEITKSVHSFYEIGKEYFIPMDKFIYKFL